jgi:hypothetical protein
MVSQKDILKKLRECHAEKKSDAARALLDLLGYYSHREGDDGFVWGFTAAVLELKGADIDDETVEWEGDY